MIVLFVYFVNIFEQRLRKKAQERETYAFEVQEWRPPYLKGGDSYCV